MLMLILVVTTTDWVLNNHRFILVLLRVAKSENSSICFVVESYKLRPCIEFNWGGLESMYEKLVEWTGKS